MVVLAVVLRSGPIVTALLVIASAWSLDVFVARPLLAWLLP
jgi:hypothetical protein